MVRAFAVDAQCQIAQQSSGRFADGGDGLIVRNVFIVAGFGLRCGRVDGLGQLRAFEQAGGQRDAADRAGALVILPAGADHVAAGDAFDGFHLAALDEHAAAFELIAVGVQRRGVFVNVGRDEVVRNHVLQEVKPEE